MEKEQLVALVTAVQRGEEDAATNLYNAFRQDLYYYIFKTANDATLAEDLLQDTFMEIFQTVGQLNEPAAFVTWSRQIAYHRCTAYFRKRRELLADEDEDGYSVFDTIEEDRAEFIPGEALDQEEFKQTIHAMIASLPSEQRSALLMRYFDEKSLKEIAEIQGVNENTVKSRLNYGRKAIKQAVEDYEKKHDIKLHSVAIIPLLLWLFREYAKANGISLTSTTASAAYTAAATGTTAASAAAPAAAAAASTGAKAVGAFAGAKLVAGILAAVVAVGGVVIGLSLNQEKNPAPQGTPSSTQHPGTGKPQVQTTTTATTLPAVPTEDELAVLSAYQTLVEELYTGSADQILSTSKTKEYYDQLMALDLSVVRKWYGTAYATGDIEWDCDAVLDGFTIHKNVVRGHKEKAPWSDLYQDNIFILYDQYGNANFEYLRETVFLGKKISFSITDGQYSFIETNPLDIWGQPYPIFDANGRVEKIERREGQSFYRDKESKKLYSVSTLHYNPDGTLASETVEIKSDTTDLKSTDNTGCIYTITYTYADNGQLTEISAVNNTVPGLGEARLVYEYNEDGTLKRSDEFTYHDNRDTTAQKTNTAIYTSYTYEADGSCLVTYDFWEESSGRDWFKFYTKQLRCTFAEDGRIATMDTIDERGNVYSYILVYDDYYVFTPTESK